VWQQFRVRYPTGSLTAELIQIHEGWFVVRAMVRIDDLIVATGLAASQTVEEAEDRARSRALELLGLSASAESPAPISPPTTHPAPVREMPVEMPRPRPSIPLPEVEGDRQQPESPQSDLIDLPADLAPPTDDSDLMMKTTVEIRRLGWSTEQGRHHLESTYGKRSRQHLTREELLDFLQYLETLE